MNIVTRLRNDDENGDSALAWEAADEIERLRSALQELLSGHDNLYVAHFGPDSDPHADIAAKAARAALVNP